MDNFNFKNLQLAYSAVYDQNLCESMEELGLIGEGSSGQDQFELWVNELLDEGYDLSDYTWDELGELYEESDSTVKRKASTKRIPVSKMEPAAAEKHINVKEDYDAFDIVLEYLLDEGFADTLEGAEAIMVNMSEGWIEGILMEKEGYGDAAIDKDPLTKFRPDAEAREYLKKNPYNVNKRFFSTSGPGRGSREASNVSDILQKMEGGSKPKRVIPSPKKSSSEPAPRKLPDPDRSKRAPKPRVLPNPKR